VDRGGDGGLLVHLLSKFPVHGQKIIESARQVMEGLTQKLKHMLAFCEAARRAVDGLPAITESANFQTLLGGATTLPQVERDAQDEPRVAQALQQAQQVMTAVVVRGVELWAEALSAAIAGKAVAEVRARADTVVEASSEFFVKMGEVLGGFAGTDWAAPLVAVCVFGQRWARTWGHLKLFIRGGEPHLLPADLKAITEMDSFAAVDRVLSSPTVDAVRAWFANVVLPSTYTTLNSAAGPLYDNMKRHLGVAYVFLAAARDTRAGEDARAAVVAAEDALGPSRCVFL